MLNTKEFAAEIKMTPGSVRKSLSDNGNVLGIRPIKLPNGRLLWPKKDLIAMLEESRAKNAF